MPGLRLTARVAREPRHVRLLLRVQLDADDLRVALGSGDADAGTWCREEVSLRDVVAVLHRERAVKLKRGVFAGERHRGGVTFDLLEPAADR